ncbi:Methyltransferase domain-containing protein [Catalinimonas alkaloidigena]|uniref:Methyltransferase domain-containing protein n=1 Tax=Catalinimonas alkaloidigena TaxID=1075417 RepID=A0A1G9IS20_9BACT|nr:class I SAM-dependent methyltransferase [Catalinimonas alkaloidigena]SDL27773.1 Methyltransferase domain-containing protein [Catalinimonas alkaloidigena]
MSISQVLGTLYRYARFRQHAGDAHSIHSPFVFHLYTEVLRPDKQYYAFEGIEQHRQRLLRDTRSLEITDFGAGAARSRQRTVQELARRSAQRPQRAQLLFRLVEFLRPAYLVELGTSLGLTTAYLAAPNPQASVVTLEGCPATAALARETLRDTQAQLVVGPLEETLAPALARLPHVDFVYFDANHRREPTLRYFRQCLAKAHEATCFVFDDIHWSREMEQAWQEIQAHPDVTLTLDLFWLGLVFFRQKQPKQHFRLRL